jgi:molecular chaperone DnaK
VNSHVLGIDLGTTNSVVAVSDGTNVRVLPADDGRPLIPSVVSFHPSGEVLIGQLARERRLIDARNTVFSTKRLIGRPFRSEEVRRAIERFPFELREGPTGGVLVHARNETYTLSEISAFVLREVREVAERDLGSVCDRAVVTVPANFNELQRSATKAAGRVAGLDVLRILNEPTAAALAYGYGRGSRERIAIFDLGGGTFDITILQLAGDVFEVLATAGDTYLGGDDIDVLLADQMAKAFLEHHRYDASRDAQAYERLRAAAEWAKCQLSFREEAKLRIEELAYGEDGVSLDLAFGIKRKTLEAMAMPLIARCFDVCEDAMKVAGIRPIQLDNVVLVGGSTRMPLVKRMVTDYFGRPPLDDIDPDLVVAKGAAIQANALVAPAERRALARIPLKRITQSQLERARSPSAPPSRPEIVGLGDEAFHDEQVVGTSPSTVSPSAVSPSAVSPSAVSPSAVSPSAVSPSAVPPSAVSPSAVPPSAVRPSAVRPSAVPPPPPPRVPPPPPRNLGGNRTLPMPGFPPPPPPPLPSRPDSARADAAEAGSPVVGRPSSMPPTPVAPPPALGVPPAARVAPTLPHHAVVAPTSPAWTGDEAPGGVTESWQPAPPESRIPSDLPFYDGPLVEPPAPPLLLDVTPHTLSVETVGGYCEGVIGRNAAIPVEQTRLFTTARDDQEVVRVRICQGESRRLDENQGLGELELTGLRRAARGAVQIGVTFGLNADGTLDVRAEDLDTGRAQHIRVRLVGGIDETEITQMRERQRALFGGTPLDGPT